MCPCLQAVALHISRKNICCLAPSILALVRACKASPPPLLALQSATLAARAHTPQEFSSSGTGFATPVHLALTRTHERRCILRLQSPCPGFLHTSRVCDPALQSPESAWSMCPPLLQLAPKMLESSTIKYDHATSSAISRHPSYMQVVSALRYVTPSSPISI